MPNFIWTVKEKSGQPAVREISAETIAESKSILLAEGCTELELKTDEIMDAATASFGKMTFLGEELEISAADQLKYRNEGRKTMTRIIGQSLVQDYKLYFLVLGLIGFWIYILRYLYAIIFGVMLFAWPVFRIWSGLPGIYYAKLIKAADWNRWLEVLYLVEALKKIRYYHFIKLPEIELARFRAGALAGLGRLTDALEEFARCEGQAGMSSWLYYVHVAGLYDRAKQYDHGLEYTIMAIQEKPTPGVIKSG